MSSRHQLSSRSSSNRSTTNRYSGGNAEKYSSYSSGGGGSPYEQYSGRGRGRGDSRLNEPQQRQYQTRLQQQQSNSRPAEVFPNTMTAHALNDTRYVEPKKRPAPPPERRLVPKSNILSPNILLPGQLKSSAPEFPLVPGVVPSLKSQARHLMGSNMIELEERMMSVRSHADSMRAEKKGGAASLSSSKKDEVLRVTDKQKQQQSRTSSRGKKGADGPLMICDSSPSNNSSGPTPGRQLILPPIKNSGGKEDSSGRHASPQASSSREQQQQQQQHAPPPAISPRLKQQQGAIEHKALECMKFTMLSDGVGAPVGVSMAGHTLSPIIGFDTTDDGGSSSDHHHHHHHHHHQGGGDGDALLAKRRKPRCVAGLFSLRHSHTPGKYVIEWDGGTARGVFNRNTTTKQPDKKFVITAVKMAGEGNVNKRNKKRSPENAKEEEEEDGDDQQQQQQHHLSQQASYHNFLQQRPRRGTPPLDSYYQQRWAALDDDIIFGRSANDENPADESDDLDPLQFSTPKNNNSKKQHPAGDGQSLLRRGSQIGGGASSGLVANEDDDKNDLAPSPSQQQQHGFDKTGAANNNKKKKRKKAKVDDGPDAVISIMLVPTEELEESRKYYEQLEKYQQQQQQSMAAGRSKRSRTNSPDPNHQQQQQQQQQLQQRQASFRHHPLMSSSAGGSQSFYGSSSNLQQQQQQQQHSSRETSPASLGGGSDGEQQLANSQLSRRSPPPPPPPPPEGVSLLSQQEMDSLGAEWEIVQILYPKRGASHEQSAELIGAPLHTIVYSPRVALRNVRFPHRLLVAERSEELGGEAVLSTRHISDPSFCGAELTRGEAEIPALFTFVVDSHFVDQFQRSLKKAYSDKASARGVKRGKRQNRTGEGGRHILGTGGGLGSASAAGGGVDDNDDDDDDFVEQAPAPTHVIHGMPPLDQFRGPGPDLTDVNFYTRNAVVTMDPCLDGVLWRITETFLDMDEHGNVPQLHLASGRPGQVMTAQQQQHQQQQHGHDKRHHNQHSSLSYDPELQHLLDESSEEINLNTALGGHQSWIFYNDDPHLTLVVGASFRGFQDSAIASAGKSSLIGLKSSSPSRDNKHNVTNESIAGSPMSKTGASGGFDSTASQQQQQQHQQSPSRRRHYISEQDLSVEVPPGATVRFFRGFVLGRVEFRFDAY